MSNWPFTHNKRWNITYSEEEEFEQFKYRISNYVGALRMKFSPEEVDLYNFYIGAPVLRANYSDGTMSLSSVFDLALEFKDYVTRLQLALGVLRQREDKDAWKRLCKGIEGCLSHSSSVGIELHRDEDKAILYPKGVELLDESVVNQSLLWLEDHPNVLKPFDAALKLYMEGDRVKQRNLLDNLRFAIEQLLKEILQNSKALENQQQELNLWLQGKAVHQQVINLYNQLLFGSFRQYQNDAVKHAEEYQEQDIEFMIYLTSTFMRLLLQLERSS